MIKYILESDFVKVGEIWENAKGFGFATLTAAGFLY
jgi:hypothetical protein